VGDAFARGVEPERSADYDCRSLDQDLGIFTAVIRVSDAVSMRQLVNQNPYASVRRLDIGRDHDPPSLSVAVTAGMLERLALDHVAQRPRVRLELLDVPRVRVAGYRLAWRLR
jgi:hypothetical protein